MLSGRVLIFMRPDGRRISYPLDVADSVSFWNPNDLPKAKVNINIDTDSSKNNKSHLSKRCACKISDFNHFLLQFFVPRFREPQLPTILHTVIGWLVMMKKIFVYTVYIVYVRVVHAQWKLTYIHNNNNNFNIYDMHLGSDSNWMSQHSRDWCEKFLGHRERERETNKFTILLLHYWRRARPLCTMHCGSELLYWKI